MDLGVTSEVLNWFKSYLSNRSQYVRIGTATSTCAALEHGIPQGSVLSPFLFNIYTDSLTSTTKSCNLESFVDDSKTFITFPVSSIFQVGDTVLVRQKRINKLSSTYNKHPYTIVKIKGSMITARNATLPKKKQLAVQENHYIIYITTRQSKIMQQTLLTTRRSNTGPSCGNYRHYPTREKRETSRTLKY